MHDLFPVLYVRVTAETYFATTCCWDVQSLPLFASASCYRSHSSCWKRVGRRCCRIRRAGHWSEKIRCWTVLYNDYNPVIVETAIVATAESGPVKTRPRTIISSPVRICQHCAGEDYKSEEYLQNREQDTHL